MTNLLLQTEFFNIYNLNNAFDQHLALRNFKKEYKKSDFYKTTHLSIFKAFTLFSQFISNQSMKIILRFGDAAAWAEHINNILANIDETTIDEFLSTLTHSLDLQGIQTEKEQLLDVMNQLKD